MGEHVQDVVRSLAVARERREQRASAGVVTDAWRDLFATALYLGLRKGELFGLRKADVRIEEGSLVVRHSHEREGTKGGDEALLPIPAPLVNYLKNALDTAIGPLLFPRENGKARKPSTSMEMLVADFEITDCDLEPPRLRAIAEPLQMASKHTSSSVSSQ